MVKVILDKILEEKQISLYRLGKDSNIGYATLHNILKNKTKQISFETINKICIALKCNISDLIEFKETPQSQIIT